MSAPKPDFLGEAEKIERVIAKAQKLLDEGKALDLAYLEDRIRYFCETAGQWDQGEKKKTEERIEDIMESLDRLETDLTARHETALGSKTGGLRRKAMAAYARTKEESS